ncbi:MAG: M28 family peptidase [Planctomycetes bacterium]|nr:M28 family peptidase [Planctomycetota bacterium]
MLDISRLRRMPWMIASVTCLTIAFIGCQSQTEDPLSLGLKGTLSTEAVPKTDSDISLADVVKETKGTIVDAPSNLRAFNPAESLTEVDASNINLRKVFEDLGDDTTLWYQHVQTLGNEFFEGRKAGTRGFELATEYLEFYMKLYGLTPAFESEDDESEGELSYKQPFGYGGRPRLTFDLQDKQFAINDEELKYKEDYVVLAPSGGQSVTAPVTFVGYGIEKADDGYSSFDEETDLTGRVALLLRYEPLNEEGTSQWANQNFSRHAAIRNKVQSLVDRGAVAIILVNPPGAVGGKLKFESLTSSSRFVSRDRATLEIPFVQVTPKVVERILEIADVAGRDLATLRSLADAGEIKMAALTDELLITVSGKANMKNESKQNPSANVAGILAGKGDLADEWIVVGGHFDHVGYGRNKTLHPGADDNASGTAGMLILAKRFAMQYAGAEEDANLRSILFMGFGAEEAGLLGSAHFVENPAILLDDISLMVNMDMIGRVRSDSLMIGGTGTADEFDEMLPRLVANSQLTIHAAPRGRGPSDHANFYKKDMPVLFLFSGMHSEYHRPGDHSYTVNPTGAIMVIDLVESIVSEVAAMQAPLTLSSSSEQASTEGRRRGRRSPDRFGRNVRLGVIPKYSSQRDTGVYVDGITEGLPAAIAGVQAGDVMLEWNGEELTGLNRMMQLLRASEAGEVVKLTIDREGSVMWFEVELVGPVSEEDESEP